MDIQGILVALLVLGIIIVIHEFGHFAVAKLFKIKVETFSVGFGPRLIGFRKGETDYRISALPLGGYVKMAGENPGDVITGEAHEFMSKPKWQRFLVAAAGPFMNIVLALVLLTGLFMFGMEVPEFINAERAVVGVVTPGSPAEKAGVQKGDRVIAIEGSSKPNWNSVLLQIATNPDRPIALSLDRNGQRIDTTVTPTLDKRNGTGDAGMSPFMRVIVKEVNAKSPAETAGIKPEDEIIALNGIDPRRTGKPLTDIIQTIEEPDFPITLLRNGQEVEVRVRPILQDGRKMIGLRQGYATVFVKYGFTEALSQSMDMNVENAKLIFQILGRLIKGEASMKQLDGPVGIVRATSDAARVSLGAIITLTAMISLNLGLVNLLPIPILDGGVMLLLFIETLMGRDLSLRIKERIVQVSMVFLLLMMVVVIYNDVLKALPSP